MNNSNNMNKDKMGSNMDHKNDSMNSGMSRDGRHENSGRPSKSGQHEGHSQSSNKK